jgi:hypothetical protein
VVAPPQLEEVGEFHAEDPKVGAEGDVKQGEEHDYVSFEKVRNLET